MRKVPIAQDARLAESFHAVPPDGGVVPLVDWNFPSLIDVHHLLKLLDQTDSLRFVCCSVYLLDQIVEGLVISLLTVAVIPAGIRGDAETRVHLPIVAHVGAVPIIA